MTWRTWTKSWTNRQVGPAYPNSGSVPFGARKWIAGSLDGSLPETEPIEAHVESEKEAARFMVERE